MVEFLPSLFATTRIIIVLVIISKIKNIIANVTKYIPIIIFLIITVVNLLVVWQYNGVETTIHANWQNPLILVSTLLVAGLVYVGYRYLKISNVALLLCLLVYSLVISFLLIFVLASNPVGDITPINIVISDPGAWAFAPHGYLSMYPQQIGLATVLDVLQTYTSDYAYSLKLINIGAVLLLLFSLYRIASTLFSKKVVKISLLLSFGLLPVFFYTSYIYNDVLGMALSVFALAMAVDFTKNRHIAYGVLAAIAIGIALFLRQNALIYLIGILLLFIITLRRTNALKTVLAVAVIPIVVVVLGLMTTHYWTRYVDAQVISNKDATPAIAWVAMGQQDYNKFGLPYGWWNDYNNDCYNKNVDTDIGQCGVQAKESLKKSLEKFASDPVFAAQFYAEKVSSQWADPTFQSLNVTANNSNSEGEYGVIRASLADVTENNEPRGKLNGMVRWFMDAYWLLLLLPATLYLVVRRKTHTLVLLIPALIIAGGFVFHVIWEAKSRYIFAYLPLFIPYAAAGLLIAYEYITRKFISYKSVK